MPDGSQTTPLCPVGSPHLFYLTAGSFTTRCWLSSTVCSWLVWIYRLLVQLLDLVHTHGCWFDSPHALRFIALPHTPFTPTTFPTPVLPHTTPVTVVGYGPLPITYLPPHSPLFTTVPVVDFTTHHHHHHTLLPHHRFTPPHYLRLLDQFLPIRWFTTFPLPIAPTFTGWFPTILHAVTTLHTVAVPDSPYTTPLDTLPPFIPFHRFPIYSHS